MDVRTAKESIDKIGKLKKKKKSKNLVQGLELGTFYGILYICQCFE